MKIIKFDNEKKYIKDFLSLPKKIYTKKTNTEDYNTVKQLITNNHPLNKYFKLTKLVKFLQSKYLHSPKLNSVKLLRFDITE